MSLVAKALLPELIKLICKQSCPPLQIPQWHHVRNYSNASSATTISRQSSPGSDSSSSFQSTPPTSEDEQDCEFECPPATPVLSIAPLLSRAPSRRQSLDTSTSTSPHFPPFRFRLEPCALEEAQAIVVVPPPSAPFVPTPAFPTPSAEEQKSRQALLFVGPAMEQFRHPQRKLAKGARIQPYRIVPSRRKESGARIVHPRPQIPRSA
jgi:hypothetical protein